MTDAGPGPPPLPARSVLLSVLLGSHPPQLPVRTLVRTAALFGISEGAARVALSRLTADGEVRAGGGSYALSDRHLERQRAQDTALRPLTRPWPGQWVLMMAGPEPGVDLSALRAAAARARMAEVRPGVWTRPDNLAAGRVAELSTAGVLAWTARPEPEDDAAHLAARLWDLAGWAREAETLLDGMAAATAPAARLSVAASMVRHLRSDPVLPVSLLPVGWPGERLREVYAAYRKELGELIAGPAIAADAAASGREDSARQRAK